jgi:hypothetical protein
MAAGAVLREERLAAREVAVRRGIGGPFPSEATYATSARICESVKNTRLRRGCLSGFESGMYPVRR